MRQVQDGTTPLRTGQQRSEQASNVREALLCHRTRHVERDLLARHGHDVRRLGHDLARQRVLHAVACVHATKTRVTATMQSDLKRTADQGGKQTARASRARRGIADEAGQHENRWQPILPGQIDCAAHPG